MPNGGNVLVTGGGTGIGEAIALDLAAQNYRVAITGRREDVLQAVAAKAPEGTEILTCPADVADRKSVENLFAWAAKNLGPIDILVNSAGVNVAKRSMAELSPEDWDLILQVNATGAFNTMRAVLPQMRSRQNGVIVNISSIAGLRAAALGGVAYNASKFAMAALGTSVANEEAQNGIRVTTIYPGEVETPILDNRPVPVSAEHRARILQPEDVSAAVSMVVKLHPRAHIPDLTIKPTAQTFV